MAFKLLNSISQLQQLYERGVCRELWVFGEVCRGVMVRGVIDELRIVKKKMKKKTRSLFPGSIKDERDHRIPGRIRTEAIPFSSSSSFACSARSEGEEGQRTETSSSSTCAFDLIEIPDWEEEQRQEEEEEEVNDVSWKGKEKENKKMSRRWRAPWMFSSPGGNSVPERDLKGRRPSTSLQGPCERMKEKGRGRSSPFAESQGRGDVDSEEEEEEERFFVLLSDNKTRSVKKTPGLSQKQTSALQLQIYWYLLDRLRHEPIPTDSFFSAFKLDPRAELTNPLLLTAAQAANVPLMAPRGVRTPKEDEEKMKKKQSGRVDTRDGSTPTMDVEMTVSEEDAESMKNDMAVVYMKGETTEEEKEKEDEEEVVDLTGDNELDTIKCSQEDLNVSLGKETRRKEEEEEEAGGEKRSQVLRLDALLKKFQEAWRQLPNLWREIHVVYECEGEEFAREKIPYHGETVEYSLQDLTSWWKGHRPAETLQSSEKWKCRSCPFLAQCKATPLDDQERKAALIEQEQADEENKRALEEFDETLALQQEQQRLEDLLRQKWQQSRRNQKAQTDSYTGADSRAEALHLSERNTRRNESSQAVNERTMTDKYQSVCDPSRGNRTHIQSGSHIFQNTEITSTEISSDKTRGTSDSCSVVSPVSRLSTGSVSKIQVEPSQSCSHVNTEHIGEVACYESKTHSSLSTPSYSRHTGLISNDVGKVVVGKELMGSRHLTQQRTVIMHSHQSRSGGGGQWVMTGRPCERDGLKSDVSSEPGLGYLNRGPASSRKRRFAGLFTTRDEQAPSKHKSQEIQGNARADSQVPRAFPGESTKERLAESKNMTGPLPVPGTGGPKSVAGFAPCGDETQHPSEHRRSKGQDSLQDCLADAGAAGNQKKGHECLMADLYTRSSAAHEKDDLCLLVSKGQQRTGSRQQQNGSAVNCSAHGPEHPKARIARTAVTSACTAEQAGREGAFTAEPCPVIGVSEACRRRSSSRFESFCSVSDPDTPQQAATNVTPAKRSNELLASRVSRSKERSNGHLLAQAQLPGKPEAGAEPGGTQNGVGKGVNCRVQEEKHGRSRGIRRGVQTKRQQSSGAKSSATFLGQCQITKYFKKP
ncbi:defects in morphology 1 precursor [Cystoisospora suis]|uniref:Defects in morphology 1 n=1 Tax=Cystoisospora suis TaxID=483139 RepID=A0A2C6KLQ0_9APIC|nr:defects in morphology 1 precursor [Cystoisospora suis]